jgi:death-on-curing family protein
MPMATFAGRHLHPAIPAMAAAYLFHLTQNHPFLDGDKRAGANAAIAFLRINDWETTFSEDELVDVVLADRLSGMAARGQGRSQGGVAVRVSFGSGAISLEVERH